MQVSGVVSFGSHMCGRVHKHHTTLKHPATHSIYKPTSKLVIAQKLQLLHTHLTCQVCTGQQTVHRLNLLLSIYAAFSLCMLWQK